MNGRAFDMSAFIFAVDGLHLSVKHKTFDLLCIAGVLTPIYMGYFDYLFYMGGGAIKPSGLTVAFEFRQT